MLGRRRRDTTELEFESLQFGRNTDDLNLQGNSAPTIDKLVKDIKQKVSSTTYKLLNCISLHYR